MSSNIDDWLQSLGLDNPIPESEPTIVSVPVVAVPQTESVVANTEPASSSEPISTEDFNAILEENGFEEPPFDEAEEATDEDEDEEEEEEENTDEYDENGGEGRDLDAEEDADWNERIASGEIRDVHFHMPDGNVIDVPVIHENEQTPAIMEADMQSLREEVSTDAREAFEMATTDVPAQELLIPLNSPTLLLNDATSRFSGTEWYNEIQRKRIILAGCGGIGSWTILQLARMNPAALFMYDDDVVEVANMSGQLYCQEDVGKAKVDAMADMIRSYTTMRNIFAINDKYTANSEAGDIMICGFDSMEARKTFFHAWRKHLREKTEEESKDCVFIDGRLSIDTLQVFCISGVDNYNIDRYMQDYLFSDSEADATQCSLKQTTYLACMIGSVIVNLFTNWVANSLNPIIPFDLPFFTEYDAQNMIFKTIK